MSKSKVIFFVEFSFVGKHLHTKFQKISSNGLDFANFLIFHLFWLFLPKSAYVVNFHVLRGIYIPNFKKFHQIVPKLICHGQTDEQTNQGESIGTFGLQPGTNNVNR